MFKRCAPYHFIAQALSARSDKLIPQRRDKSQFVSPVGLATPLLWILAFGLEVTDRIQLSVSAWESDDAVESSEGAPRIMTGDTLIKLYPATTSFCCRSAELWYPSIHRFDSNNSQSFRELKAESQASFGNVAPGCLCSLARLLKCDYVHDVRLTRGFTQKHISYALCHMITEML